MSSLTGMFVASNARAESIVNDALTRRLWAMLPVALHLCGADGQILRYNRRAAELWGREPRLKDPGERYCGALRMYRLDGRPLLQDEGPMAEALRTGCAISNREVVIERPDGERKIALVNIAPLTDEDGVLIGAISCLEDISTRKSAEAAARQAEQRLKSILDVLPAAVYTTDPAGKITYFNKAAADFAGREPKIGSDEWCVSHRLFWPDGRLMQHDECPMATTLKEGREVRGAEAIAERPDGMRVAFEPHPALLRDDTGAIVGALNMLIDISGRKRDEESTLRLAAIVESSEDAIISKNLNGIITTWNRAAERIFGYLAEEAIGKPITMLIPIDSLDEETAIIERIRRGERVEHYETVRQRKDGGLIDVSLSVSPIRDKHGAVVGASKIARDITDRKRKEAQIEILAREAEHRTKNVLATVQAAVQLSEAQTVEALKAAISGRIQALANVHALFVKSRWVGAELASLIEQELSPYSRDGKIRASFLGPRVLLDPNAAQAMAVTLHELTTNAAKYGALSNDTGRIEVEWARAANGKLVLSWAERDGPKIEAAPAHKGFGMRLVEAMIQSQPGGEVRLDWRPDGLIFELGVLM